MIAARSSRPSFLMLGYSILKRIVSTKFSKVHEAPVAQRFLISRQLSDLEDKENVPRTSKRPVKEFVDTAKRVGLADSWNRGSLPRSRQQRRLPSILRSIFLLDPGGRPPAARWHWRCCSAAERDGTRMANVDATPFPHEGVHSRASSTPFFSFRNCSLRLPLPVLRTSNTLRESRMHGVSEAWN